MNYIKIYESLIARGKLRIITDYCETHHVIPRCMGGSNNSNNLVKLTPEEHYLAHQLLVKIYPTNHNLVLAATMMCGGYKRNNKLYGWLRRKHSHAMKIFQSGNNNSQHGTKWISNPDKNNSKKIPKQDIIPYGYYLGRNLKWKICPICNNKFISSIISKYCSDNCKETVSKIKITDKEANNILHDYESGMPMKKLLVKYNRNSEQSVSTFLRIRFPNRKKFLPKKREIYR